MLKRIGTGFAAALLAGCGGGGEAGGNEAAAEKAAALAAGEYELSTTVEELRSTDDSTPATALKAGAPATVTRACVAADGTVDADMFAEGEDECSVTDSYLRNGRMSVQLRCTRAGKSGNVMQLADGDFSADSFEATVLGSTGFGGPGDYEMTRKVTARRVGDCPAAETAAG